MPGQLICATITHGGYRKVTDGRHERRVGEASVVRFPHERDYVAEWDDLGMTVLRVPIDVVGRVAAERTTLRGDLTFDGLAPVSATAERRWHQLIRLVETSFAAEPITLSDIAEAVGVTPRALRHGFVRHLDTTPMAYLRRLRLEGAHHDLRSADPGTGATVNGIAGRWGFADHRRFAARYREAYGHSPGETLRA